MLSKSLLSSGKCILPLLLIFSHLYTDSLSQNMSIHQHSSYTNVEQTVPFHSAQTNYTDPVRKLRIIAVMVEFQPDQNRFTSGNGTFDRGSIPYLEDPGTNVDALPHDQKYFEAHLTFVKNYFEKQSNRQISIEYQVLPTIYRLGEMMETYSPIGKDPDLSPLANFVKDTWELVGSDPAVTLDVNPDETIAFVIFHAGIGRDVELTGTTLDKTPQDIPSVYLSNQALRDLFDDPTFSGFEFSKGNLIVDHTLILPRTLSRSGVDFSGNRFIIPLSINGLLTAQIGRRIGLPNLFNTETGKSGIGRFGLMDGAGIFAFNGLFPPGLSAWEKIYLGWQKPFEIDFNHTDLVYLPASSRRADKSIAKIPLSNSEYFLVENRHRDPDSNGVTLTIQRPDGSKTQQIFTNIDTDFVTQAAGFDKLIEPGVVIDVSNYDFALPGGLSNEGANQRELNGGILIWHIDETVIRNQIHTIGINSNPDRKGIELKEADGAQDIGRPTNIGISQNEPNGSAFDFWWSGNNSSVISNTDTLSLYENRFGQDTFPNNRSHTGAISNFELYDFSDNIPEASFKIREISSTNAIFELITVDDIESITTSTSKSDQYWNRYPLAIQSIATKNLSNSILIPGRDGLIIYNVITGDFKTLLEGAGSLQQPLTGMNSNGFLAIAPNPLQSSTEMNIITFRILGESVTETGSYSVTPNSGFLSSSEAGIIDIDGTQLRIDTDSGSLVQGLTNRQISEKIGQTQSVIENNKLTIRSEFGSISHPIPTSDSFTRIHTGLIQNGEGLIYAYLLLDNQLILYSPTDQYSNEIVLENRTSLGWPAIVDLNDDGNPEFLYVSQTDGKLYGKNINSGMLSGFPINPPTGIRFIGTPLIADLDGNGSTDLLITAEDSYSISIYAYRSDSVLMEEFPLLVGGIPSEDHQMIHPMLKDRYLIAVSPENDLKIWEFPELTRIKWSSMYGNTTNNKITGSIESGSSQPFPLTLLNRVETYNWPNPATDETYIRFQTVTPAQIRLRITTMSGRVVTDRRFSSMGGPPEELLINTSTWASGAYYALLEASSGNSTERKLIKIAIVR